MDKRAQSAIEFIILLGAVIAFFVVFLVIVQNRLSDKAYEQRDVILNDIVSTVRDEVSLAHKASDGYERVFNIPDTVLNTPYIIRFDGGWVYAETNDGKHAISLPIENTTGSPRPGDNAIRKLHGIVYLN